MVLFFLLIYNVVVPTGPSNQGQNDNLNDFFNDGDDDIFAEVLENYQGDTG